MKISRAAQLLLASLLAATVAAGADWNQWRGPNRDGIVSGFVAPAVWSVDSFAKKWTVTVGEGHASPVIVGDRVYVFAREAEREIMRCLALADGKVIWQEAYAAPYEMNGAARGHGKGPKATPAVVDGRVFALGINGHLSAWDAASGRVLWRKSFAGEFKETAPVFGAAASPIVDGGNVILHVGGKDNGALTGFDAATGAVKWKWDGDGPAYTSPVIATLGGIRQLITQSQKFCLAVSPADGRLLWQLPFTTSYEQNIVTPIVVGDLVIFAGVRKPTFAVKVAGATATPAWETTDVTMYMSSPVLNGTKLHGLSEKSRGTLFTLDATTGKVLWKNDGKVGTNASVTDLGAALLVVTDGGELTVQQKTGDALKELVKLKVSEAPVWAAPAVAGNHLLIKDATTLALFTIGGNK